eukprot:COSAG05_NODE_15110_length_378_cov_0.781362_1_plen_30_part_10
MPQSRPLPDAAVAITTTTAAWHVSAPSVCT